MLENRPSSFQLEWGNTAGMSQMKIYTKQWENILTEKVTNFQTLNAQYWRKFMIEIQCCYQSENSIGSEGLMLNTRG